MKSDTSNHFFRFTKLAWKAYKEDDPLHKTRNPRPVFFLIQWDINMGITLWFFYAISMIFALVGDLILFPFHAFGWIVFSGTRQKINDKGYKENDKHSKLAHRRREKMR
jgi:hypothetical protein